MNVGEIVKFKDENGNEVVGIVYENGNKKFGEFRVQSIGAAIHKHRHLTEAELYPATPEELSEYAKNSFMKLLADWGPEWVIASEAAETGGDLLPQLTEPPVLEHYPSQDNPQDN